MEDDETLVDQSSPETNFPEVTQIIRASQQTSRTASATDRDDCTATPDAALTHDEKVDHKETSDTSEDEVNDKIEEHVTTSDTLSPRKNEEAGRSPMESGPEKEAGITDKSDAEGSGEDEAELDQERPAVAAASPPKTRKRKLTNSRDPSPSKSRKTSPSPLSYVGSPRPTPRRRPKAEPPSSAGTAKPTSHITISSTSRTPSGSPKLSSQRLSSRSPPPRLQSSQSRSQPDEQASRPTKRPRLNVPSASAPATSTRKSKRASLRTSRHPTFWHLDGSVVLQVHKTLFKLHRSRLVQQSEYFAALFSGTRRGQATDEEDLEGETNGIVQGEIIDSCPVYKITTVSVEDFVSLLTALDSGIAYAINPPPFPVLASILRAAHTLSFPAILTYATHILRQMWPDDLAQLSSVRKDFATETVALARQCNVPSLLKRAYYELLRTPIFGQRANGDGWTSEDEDEKPGQRLPAPDLLCLVAARELLLREWIQTTRAPPSPSVVPCPLDQILPSAMNPELAPALESCRRARAQSIAQWTAHVTQADVFEAGMYDPLCGLDSLAEIDWAGMGYCVGCVSVRQELWMDKKERLWKKLNVWLQLCTEEGGTESRLS
ncbi:hypothetical protein AcW1_002820 [Taiwanofungus camphoratus]|nr:hypothetical protein AcW1_002820 [Antrodia cinnamomea]